MDTIDVHVRVAFLLFPAHINMEEKSSTRRVRFFTYIYQLQDCMITNLKLFVQQTIVHLL